MNFLILGCNGMAGHVVSMYLQSCGHDVAGFSREKSPFVDTILGDASDFISLAEIVNSGNFDCVVNCVGLLNKNAENNIDKAVLLNSYLPHYLEKITRGSNTQLIHISTDCVFSGKKGHYKEKDLKDGETFYDRTKALGEVENEKDFTIRTSIIGPDLKKQGFGLLNWFLQQNGIITGYQGALWTGITTIELAKNIEFIALNKLHGLYNVVPEKPVTKYDLLCLINKCCCNGDKQIISVQEPIIDKSLVGDQYRALRLVSDYNGMIEELALWLKKNAAIYPHYQGLNLNA